MNENLWAQALLTANYILNRLPNLHLKDISPFEFVFKEIPKLDHLWVFGCEDYYLIPKYCRQKFGPNTNKGILNENYKIIHCRSVTFNESQSIKNFTKHNSQHDKNIQSDTTVFVPIEETDICQIPLTIWPLGAQNTANDSELRPLQNLNYSMTRP